MIFRPYRRGMERVLLTELRMLAIVYGAGSVAGRALTAARKLQDPQVFRCGRRLLVCEAAVEDTIVIRRFW